MNGSKFTNILKNTRRYFQQADKVIDYKKRIENRKKKIELSTKKHNMDTNKDERYYELQYWYWMENDISMYFKDECELNIVDLGCGQGRLTKHVAQKFPMQKSKITGVDISRNAINYARDVNNFKNINYVLQDINDYLREQENNSIDMLICTELFFYLDDLTETLRLISNKIKRKSRVYCSFRPRQFNLNLCLRNYDFSKAKLISEKNKGEIFGKSICFNWADDQEIRDQLNKVKMITVDMMGIGCFSGISGDPGSLILQPSNLNDQQLKALLELEIRYSRRYINSSRYIMCIATADNNE